MGGRPIKEDPRSTAYDSQSATPEVYLSQGDRIWFQRLPAACLMINEQVNSVGGNIAPKPVIGRFIHNRTEESQTFFIAFDTKPTEKGYEFSTSELAQDTLLGTIVAGIPSNIWQINLVTPETGTRIPVDITTGKGVLLSERDGKTTFIPQAGQDNLKIGELIQALKADNTPVWHQLSDKEKQDLEALGNETNIFPAGFSLEEIEYTESEIPFGLNTVAAFITSVLEQPPESRTTPCFVLTRGNTQIMLISGFHTKRNLENLISKSTNAEVITEIIELFFTEGRDLNLDFAPRAMYAVKKLAKILDFKIFTKQGEGNYKLVPVEEADPRDTGLSEQTAGFSAFRKEERIAEEMRRHLELCGIPRQALIMGNLHNFMSGIGLPLLSDDVTPLISFDEFAALLRVIKEWDLRFVGSNILVPQIIGSKLGAVMASEWAQLPYPETYLIAKGEWQQLHPGIPAIDGQKPGAVLKKLTSSLGMGTYFLPEFKPNDFDVIARVYKPDEKYLYMREIAFSAGGEQRVRDTRTVFDPHTEKIVTIHDRVGATGNRRTNIAQGGEWRESLILRNNRIKGGHVSFLSRFDRGLTQYLTASVFGDDMVERVLNTYEVLGMVPTTGICGFDVAYPNGNYPSSKSDGSPPFVCELHHVCALPDEGTQEVIRYYTNLARNRSAVVLFPDIILSLPQLADALARQKYGVPVLVENLDADRPAKFLRLKDDSEREQALDSLTKIRELAISQSQPFRKIQPFKI